MKESTGNGFEVVGRLAQPRPDRVRIDVKHPGHCAKAQAFGQGGYYLHDPVGRSEFAIEKRAMRFKEIGVTDHAVELPPSPTPRMTVRTDIDTSHPAIVSACFHWTELSMGVDRSRAPSLGGEPRWWRQRRLGDVIRVLLTGLAGRLFSQAGKGLGGVWWFLGLLSRQVFRRLPSLSHPIREHQLPEQCEEQELVDKQITYHLIPFPCRSTGGMLSAFRANELSAGWRYTTGLR